MRVALVHDWLTGMRGGERCLEVFCELFPDADLYTLLHVPGSVSPSIERMHIRTSFLQRLPAAATAYRSYLPLFPAAIALFDFSEYDLLISTSHCVAKAAKARDGALHICYCLTPMRYVWDLYDDYFGRNAGMLTRLLMPPIAQSLRWWDRASSRRVHRFVAISRFVADRIMRCYGREAQVIYPPVEARRFQPVAAPGDYYLVVSALVPYKRVDLAVGAANRLGARLIVVGSGPELRRLRAMAAPSVEFLGWRNDAEVAELYARCRAVLFPGVEDFGIVPLEAMAAGRPVVALGAGGALETIVPLDDPNSGSASTGGPTGVFFSEQTRDAVVAAIRRFEANAHRFEPKVLRDRALAFDRQVFKEKIAAFVADRWLEHLRRRGEAAC